MKLFDWRNKSWRERIMLILTIIVVVVLASHPELRLFLPLVDALGLDLLLALMGAQFLDYMRPLLYMLHHNIVLPSAVRLYSLIIFFFGIAGPYLDARIATCRFSHNNAM